MSLVWGLKGTCLHALLPFVLMFSANAWSESAKKSSKGVVMEEISIIGNTELPNVSFELPWRLPTVQQREESQPLEVLDGMLVPIDPVRHQQSVFFSQYLELKVPNYKVK